MNGNDSDSDLSEAPTASSKPASEAVLSTASTLPYKTRHKADRIGILPPKQKKLPFTQRASGSAYGQGAVAAEPIGIEDELADTTIKDTDCQPQDPFTNVSPYTPGPGLSVSQSSETSAANKKRTRQPTSDIYARATLQTIGSCEYYVCNSCSKKYMKSGGTTSMRKHLKDVHRYDPEATSITKKRQGEGLSVMDAIYRQAAAAEEEKVEASKNSGQNVNKATMEYLYI